MGSLGIYLVHRDSDPYCRVEAVREINDESSKSTNAASILDSKQRKFFCHK